MKETLIKWMVFWLSGVPLWAQTVFAAQNLPVRQENSAAAQRMSATLDRLTLLLTDRLPTPAEKAFIRVHGIRALPELASVLVRSKDFFDRQSLYWQAQFNQSPAWQWENQRQHAIRQLLARQPTHHKGRLLYYFPASDIPGTDSTCNGMWSAAAENSSGMCRCDEVVDVLPYWDASSPLRVCRSTTDETVCGKTLENCVPVDSRISGLDEHTRVDAETAGGRSISRLLRDLSLIHGRSLAVGVMMNHKISELTNSPHVVMTRSSIALLEKWTEVNPYGLARDLTAAFDFSSSGENLKNLLQPQLTNQDKISKTKLLTEIPAEELIYRQAADARIIRRPLRPSRMSDTVWNWNSELVLKCRQPDFESQTFHLPLPSPHKARAEEKFCLSCHTDIDKNMVGSNSDQNLAARMAASNPRENEDSEKCAVAHGVRFLLGRDPGGPDIEDLRKAGLNSLRQKNQSLIELIKDLAVRIAERGGSG